VAALCANNPLEVMRIRHQLLEYRCEADRKIIKRGYWRLGLSILLNEGVSAFYRGLKPRLICTLPGIVIALTGYESIKEFSNL
jgi:hypothetical protein